MCATWDSRGTVDLDPSAPQLDLFFKICSSAAVRKPCITREWGSKLDARVRGPRQPGKVSRRMRRPGSDELGKPGVRMAGSVTVPSLRTRAKQGSLRSRDFAC